MTDRGVGDTADLRSFRLDVQVHIIEIKKCKRVSDKLCEIKEHRISPSRECVLVAAKDGSSIFAPHTGWCKVPYYSVRCGA